MASVVAYNHKDENAHLLSQSIQGDLESREESKQTRRVFGQVRSLRRLRWVEWLFLVIATITLLGLLGFSIERLVSVKNNFGNFTATSEVELFYPSSAKMPIVSDERGWVTLVEEYDSAENCNEWTCLNDFIFAVLLLVNMVFCGFFCYDGILRERPLEMIGYAVGIFLITLYVIVDYVLEGNQGDEARLIRLVLIILMAPQNIVLAFVVQHKMGYRVLGMIGSKKSLTKVYHTRSLFLLLQCFNLQVLANVLVLSWAKGGLFITITEKTVVPLLLVIMITVTFLGWIAVTWESILLSIVWLFMALPSGGFYVFKIVNVAVNWKDYEEVYTEYYNNDSLPEEAYFVIEASIILFLCGAGLLCIALMCVFMYVTVKNFGNGLKERLPPPCSSCDHSYNQNTNYDL